MPAADHPASAEAAAGARPPAAHRPPSHELARLRKRVDQQEHSLAVMAEAISALRDGSRALREENRELRLELQATRSSSTRRSPGRLTAAADDALAPAAVRSNGEGPAR
jgi:hypothetical protein